jgi:sulfur relay (sulfurtransferase) DsrC/TusE family protein
MATIAVGGVSIEVDEDGSSRNRRSERGVALHLARTEGSTPSAGPLEGHHYLRDYYQKFGVAPCRKLCKELGRS